jgi:hypothetical protein
MHRCVEVVAAPGGGTRRVTKTYFDESVFRSTVEHSSSGPGQSESGFARSYATGDAEGDASDARPAHALPTCAAAFSIPKVIYQTTHFPKRRVPDLLTPHAKGYEVNVYNDAQCEVFLRTHFPAEVLAKYRELSKHGLGAHKSDLWRYCVLYKKGGIYMDIKTQLTKPLGEVLGAVPHTDTGRALQYERFTWFGVLSTFETSVYNGFLASPPNNPVFSECIKHVVATPISVFKSHYLVLCEHIKDVIEQAYGLVLSQTLTMRAHESEFVLFREVCEDENCSLPEFGGRKDRYNLCCNAFFDGKRQFVIREPTYPNW